MGLFSVNKSAKYAAQLAEAQASQEKNTLQLEEFGRNLLSNIRQERMARSQLEFSNYIEGVNTSSAAGAISNIDSSLAGEVGYAYRYSHRLENIQNYQQQATEQWEKYAKSVKKAKTNATIAVAAAGVAGGFFLAPVAAAAGLGTAAATAAGVTAGSALGAGAVSLMGDNSIAGNAAWSTALKQSTSAWATAGFDSLTSTTSATPVGGDVTGTAKSGGNVMFTEASYTGSTTGSTLNNIKAWMSENRVLFSSVADMVSYMRDADVARRLQW